MTPVEYSRKRILAVRRTIETLRHSEFPYEHSREALNNIDILFKDLLKDVDSAKKASDPDAINAMCSATLDRVFEYLPLLGFVLRSTNVRNAFEIHGPLLRLSCKLLEREAKLLISSEWDYSPLMYCDIPYLPGFVLIGLPATESSNPLLVPLAGHELGHSVWAKHGYDSQLREKLERAVIDEIKKPERWQGFQKLFSPDTTAKRDEFGTTLFDNRFIAPVAAWSLKQAEESFCDFIALKIFGVSYLHAFAYLLAPGWSGSNLPHHPNLQTRLSNLRQAAKAYHVEEPQEYDQMFSKLQEHTLLDRTTSFMLSVTDAALGTVVEELIKEAEKIVNDASIPVPTPDRAEKVYARLALAVPAQNSGGLANILNAGWRAFHHKTLWRGKLHISKKQREQCLKEVVLKSIEILEVEQLRGKVP